VKWATPFAATGGHLVLALVIAGAGALLIMLIMVVVSRRRHASSATPQDSPSALAAAIPGDDSATISAFRARPMPSVDTGATDVEAAPEPEPEPLLAEPEPEPAAPEPVPVLDTPEPALTAPDTAFGPPEPVISTPEPLPTDPEPFRTDPEPIPVGLEPVTTVAEALDPTAELTMLFAEAIAPGHLPEPDLTAADDRPAEELGAVAVADPPRATTAPAFPVPPAPTPAAEAPDLLSAFTPAAVLGESFDTERVRAAMQQEQGQEPAPPPLPELDARAILRDHSLAVPVVACVAVGLTIHVLRSRRRR